MEIAAQMNEAVTDSSITVSPRAIPKLFYDVVLPFSTPVSLRGSDGTHATEAP